MPDFSYIDQVFDKATPGASVSEEDARAVENLYRQDNEEEEKKKAASPGTSPTRVAGREDNVQRGGMDMIQGAIKWVEENVGIPLEDTIDNVFQGNQRTPEQVSQDRAGRRENMGQQLQQQKTIEDLPEPVRGPAKGLVEVGRTVAGGATGAAETVLNTAEIAGDTARYFATLGNVNADQNPFSNKYEWASWDLGKSTIGAETGVGKVAQGFLEFGALMAGTGGFASLPAAGAKFAAATTALGKAGVVAKAGLVGARSGIAADMMSATRGEGNLSNLIKEHAPEWYPSWATALAVDEDDSPVEAMLKTGLEGMGIGFAADAVGAYLGGVRAARRVLKAGGTEDEAAQAAVEEAKEAIDLTTPASSGPLNYTKPTTPEDYVQALEATKASDPAQYWSVDGIDLETAAKGKVISVEGGSGLVGPDGDIKGVFKDPTSERKGVADEILQEAVRQGGIKLDNFDTYLTRIYERNGFRTVGRVPFNADYAPPGWDEALHGRPDVVAMIYDPKGLIEERHLNKSFTDYDEMIAVRDETLNYYPHLRAIKDQLSSGSTARRVTPLPNGNQVEWRLELDRDVPAAYRLPEGTKAIEVQWSLRDTIGAPGLDTYGRRLYTDFQRMAREELEPGTILFNAPASDSYGAGGASAAQARRAGRDLPNAIDPVLVDGVRDRFIASGQPLSWNREFFAAQYDNMSLEERLAVQAGFAERDPELFNQILVATHNRNSAQRPAIPTDQRSIRERLYTRAGFGPVNGVGIQAAVVRNSPDGRGRWLQPVDLDSPEILSQINAERHYLTRANDSLSRIPQQDLADPRKAALEKLAEQAKRGIPVTWDDVASVVPDMFTPGARQLDALSPRVLRELQPIQPGIPAIVDPVTGLSPSGYAVNIDLKRIEGELTPEDIEAFIGDNLQIISREDVALMASIGEDGVKTLELVRITESQDEAVFLGNLFDRPSIHDAGLLNKITLGGADSLRGTQGQHLASRFGTPMESRTVTPEEAISQQMAARTNPDVRGGAQRMVTTHQLERIARSIGDAPTQVLRNMVRDNPINLEELSHLSRMSVDQVVADAAKGIQDAMGAAGEIDFDKILRMNVDGEELLSRAGIVQVRGLMQEVTTRLYDSAYNIMKAGDVNMDVFPQVDRMATELKALMRIHKVSANTYSHLLSDHKLRVPGLGIEVPNPFKPPSPEEIAKEIKNADKVLDEIVKGLSTGDTAAKQQSWRLANALMLTEGDPSKMPALWRHITEVTVGEGLSIMYNSLLSGPKTHLVNSLSNAINTVYRPLTAFAGGDAAVRKSATAGFYNFHKSLGESALMAFKALKDGPIDAGDKGFVIAAETQAKLQILHRAAELSDDAGFKAAVGYLDMTHAVATFPLFSWPTRLLATEDAFFKTLTARMEYNSRTMMDAISETAGTAKPTDEVFKELLTKNLDNAFDAKSGAIKDKLLEAAAKDVTFQTELEGSIKHFAAFVNAFPPMRAFFPFVKTGHDIMIYAGTHVPVLNTFLKEYKDVMAGDDAYLKAIYKGRAAFGRMLVVGGAALAASGNITGNGPMDPQEKKLWLLNHQPRSIKVGDKWVDYSRIEPFGQILSGVADLFYLFNSGKLAEDKVQYMAGYLTYAIASNFTNKSTMAGVAPLSRLMAAGVPGQEMLVKTIAEIANNFAPLASARRSFSNMMTPYKQEFNTLLDGLLYQASGGLARNGATAYDWTNAQPIPNPSGGGNALSPLAVHERGKDRVKDALEDIEYDSSVIMKSITGVKLDARHRSRLTQLMGQSGLRSELDAWVNHPDFKPAVEEFQQRLRAGERVHKENAIFYNEITRIIERYRDQALEQVKQEFPELQAEIIDQRRIKDSQRRPVQETKPIDFEHLVNMPVK